MIRLTQPSPALSFPSSGNFFPWRTTASRSQFHCSLETGFSSSLDDPDDSSSPSSFECGPDAGRSSSSSPVVVGATGSSVESCSSLAGRSSSSLVVGAFGSSSRISAALGAPDSDSPPSSSAAAFAADPL